MSFNKKFSLIFLLFCMFFACNRMDAGISTAIFDFLDFFDSLYSLPTFFRYTPPTVAAQRWTPTPGTQPIKFQETFIRRERYPFIRLQGDSILLNNDSTYTTIYSIKLPLIDWGLALGLGAYGVYRGYCYLTKEQ